jgi:hypothetical protein
MDNEKLKEAGRKFGLTEPAVTSGMVVKYDENFYRVRKVTKNTVNLGSIFGRTMYHKGVDKSKVKEAHDEWYAIWQQSDTYKCM